MKPYMATHQSPDMDAIGGIWLLSRFGGFTNHSVEFVNTGTPDPAILANANAVVATGKIYDVATFRFDPLPGKTCAAKQIYDVLRHHVELEYLEPVINLILAGDSASPEADESQILGLHGLLAGYKKIGLPSDIEVLYFGFSLLDTIESNLRHREIARIEKGESQ